MRTKVFLAAMCLSVALCTPAFSGDSCSPQSGRCRNGHVREWLKAVVTVQCKTCIFCQNPPAPEPAPKDAPKTDCAKRRTEGRRGSRAQRLPLPTRPAAKLGQGSPGHNDGHYCAAMVGEAVPSRSEASLRKSRQPGTGGKGLLGVVAASGLADNPHGNRLDRRRQPQRELLAGLQVSMVRGRRRRIIGQLADRFPRAALLPADLHLRFALAAIEPPAVVETLAMGEDHAAEIAPERARQPQTNPPGRLAVEGDNDTLQIVVEDGARQISLPRSAFLAVGKQRSGRFAATPGRRSQTRYSPPPAPASAKGTKTAVCGSFPFCPTTLPSKARPGPGLRVNSGCDSTRPQRLWTPEGPDCGPGRRPARTVPRPGPHVRRCRTRRRISLGPRWKSTAIRSPLFQARDGKTTQPAESALYFVPATSNLRGCRPGRHADLDAESGRSGRAQR